MFSETVKVSFRVIHANHLIIILPYVIASRNVKVPPGALMGQVIVIALRVRLWKRIKRLVNLNL